MEDLQCDFCGFTIVGQPLRDTPDSILAIPEHQLAKFESDLGRKAKNPPTHTGKSGTPVYVVCPRCARVALKSSKSPDRGNIAQSRKWWRFWK